MTIGVIAKLQVQIEKTAAFEKAFLQFQQTVREKEEGNIFFQLHRCQQQQGSYTVMEQYVDQAAFDDHMQTEYYKAIPVTFADFMAGPPDIQVLDVVTV